MVVELSREAGLFSCGMNTSIFVFLDCVSIECHFCFFYFVLFFYFSFVADGTTDGTTHAGAPETDQADSIDDLVSRVLTPTPAVI